MTSPSGRQKDGKGRNTDDVAFFNAVEGSGTPPIDANLARAYPAVQLSFSGVYAPEKEIEEFLTCFSTAHHKSPHVLCFHRYALPFTKSASVASIWREHTFFVRRRPEHGMEISLYQESIKTPQNYTRNLLCIGADSDM